ncbi:MULTISPECIES: hypothetical protein [unclassified Bradyrhizobium]|uniref:hypothetical protein n=1 Tax=unclassified Bradyrhizobium TaxID=2631580 RepID=UPI002916AB84|nr:MULTISPECIES: hypothetical protein [unclassified Bradyrhizobium]
MPKFKDGGAVPADVPEASVQDNTSSPLKAQIEASIRAAEQPPQPPDPLDSIPLPPLAKDWLRKNPEYLYDGPKNERLQRLHFDLVNEGHEAYGPEYFAEVDRRLAAPADDETADRALATAKRHEAATAARQRADDDDAQVFVSPNGNRLRVSAPPSREGTIAASYMGGREYDLSQGRITLTGAQKEAARISGISEREYAAQLLELRARKQAGDYGGSP